MLTIRQFNATIDRLEDARILMAALEFKVFTILEQKAMTARQIATRARAQLEGMTCLLDALVTLGALRNKNGRYTSAPDMYRYLCAGSPQFQKGTAFLKLEKNDEWANLIRIIRKGRDPGEYDGGDDPRWRALFTHAMHERSEIYRDSVAEILSRDPIQNLLDVGCGPGSYSAAILRRNRQAQATLLDRPAALRVAKELFGGKKIFKRMRFIRGDLFAANFRSGYDTVLFSNILHIYNPDQNRELLRKIHDALEPGGRVAVVDYFLNDARTAPYEAALFSLTMLMFTARGQTYSARETEGLLKATGFHRIRQVAIEEGAGIMIAHRK